MAIVRLRSPLRELAGGRSSLRVDGGTVREALRSLEQAQPGIAGWVLDEHGRIRRHVNVFVNGERRREEAVLTPDDVVHVLSAISGGAQ